MRHKFTDFLHKHFLAHNLYKFWVVGGTNFAYKFLQSQKLDLAWSWPAGPVLVFNKNRHNWGRMTDISESYSHAV